MSIFTVYIYNTCIYINIFLSPASRPISKVCTQSPLGAGPSLGSCPSPRALRTIAKGMGNHVLYLPIPALSWPCFPAHPVTSYPSLHLRISKSILLSSFLWLFPHSQQGHHFYQWASTLPVQTSIFQFSINSVSFLPL